MTGLADYFPMVSGKTGFTESFKPGLSQNRISDSSCIVQKHLEEEDNRGEGEGGFCKGGTGNLEFV